MRLFFLLVLLTFPYNLSSLEVVELTTKKDIKLWFVKDDSLPIISINFSFNYGSFHDNEQKSGTANLLASMLDESTANFNSKKFQEKMKSIGMKLRFTTSQNKFSGTFQTISENVQESFELLKIAINRETFDEDDVKKVKNQIKASLRFKQSDISSISSRLFTESFYLGHKFSNPIEGNSESIDRISSIDLLKFRDDFFVKSSLKIGVSGNILQTELLKYIDYVFGDLELRSKKDVKIPKFEKLAIGKKYQKKTSPQTAVVFGQKGLSRKDKNFFALRIVNYVLGGGGFQSRLYKKIREQNGLVYSIYSYLIPYNDDGVILGGFQTKNESVNETINILKSEWNKIKTDGITKSEFIEAKSYYLGSFSRNYTSTRSIASLLNTIQFYELDINYFQDRKMIINNISHEEVNKIARDIFDSEKLFFAIVGGS